MQSHSYATVRRTAVLTGLQADRVGAVATGVLRFDAAPVVNDGIPNTEPLSEWANIVTTANDGTRVTFLRRGVYSVKLMATVPASGGAAYGIAYNAPGATLLATANPINGTPGVRAGAHAIAPVSTQIPVTLVASILVTDQQLGAGTTVLHFLGNDGAGGALAAGDVVAAQVRAEIAYEGDLQGA